MTPCPEVLAIIVTHDSGSVLPLCLESLENQENIDLSVVVVDSGSTDRGYLYKLQHRFSFTLIEETNIGFARANNKGYQALEGMQEFVVFLNPDAFLTKGYMHKAIEVFGQNPEAAVVSGVLEGYDPEQKQPTGLMDSTGVFRKWYGRWYDRNQGDVVKGLSFKPEELPAVCGALMVCRKNALDELGHDIFDPDFFLYKEDIELSLRLRKQGWKLLFSPHLRAYHCRGWNPNRNHMPAQIRLMAARSEILLYRKQPSPYIIWAFLKYALVRWINI